MVLLLLQFAVVPYGPSADCQTYGMRKAWSAHMMTGHLKPSDILQ